MEKYHIIAQSNKLMIESNGNEWYAKTQSDGTQVWAQVRNGNIIDGGLNKTSKLFNSETGLKLNLNGGK